MTEAFLKMKKFNLGELESAYNGVQSGRGEAPPNIYRRGAKTLRPQRKGNWSAIFKKSLRPLRLCTFAVEIPRRAKHEDHQIDYLPV